MSIIKEYNDIYNKDGIKIIEKSSVDLSDLIKNLEKWHEEIAEIILNPNTIYYYATDNYDSDSYLDELPKKDYGYVKNVLELLIKNPEELNDEYEKKSLFAEKVKTANTIAELEKIIKEAGIKTKIDSTNLEKAKSQINKALCMDYCYGVFGEILFYTVVENVLNNELLASKVQYITAPGTNAHGSDGIFCNEDDKKLYFGEAKFTINLQHGLSQAINSMNHCLERIKLDKDFILTHQKSLKNGYGKIINSDNISQYENKIIIFLLHGKEIDINSIVDIINKNKNSIAKKLGKIEFIVVSFPIFDKDNLKKEIANGVSNYDTKYRTTK